MTLEVHSLGRLRLYEETSGNFATDASGSLGSFIDVPIQEGSAQLTLTYNQLEPLTQQQFIDGYPKTVLGTKRASLSFTMVLAPTGTSYGEATSSLGESDVALARMLKITMGGFQSGQTGSAVATSNSSSVFIVDASDGGNFEAGGACGWVNSSSVFEMREIESISTDTITTKHAFSGTPAASDVIYNAGTAYFTENPSSSIQMVVEGVETDDRWLLLGGQGSFSIDLPIGELPTITFSIEFANYLNEADASGSFSSAIAAATYSNFQPVHVAGEFLAQVTGTATRSIIQTSSITFTPNFSYGPITSPSGTQTIYRWRRLRDTSSTCEVSFTPMYENETTWFDERDGRDDYHLALQIGSAAGSSVLIVCPTAQIVDVQRSDDSGLAAQTVTARARLDTDTTASGDAELARSPFRIHFG